MGLVANGVAAGHSSASHQVRGLASLPDAQTTGLTLPQVDRLPEPPNSSFPKPDIPEPPATSRGSPSLGLVELVPKRSSLAMDAISPGGETQPCKVTI